MKMMITSEYRKQPDARWYSHKFHGPSVAYELGIAICSNQLVWIKSPFKAAEHGITLFGKPDGLMSKIPAEKRVIGNSGYTGKPEHVSTNKPS
jgi:hypothetical protein